MVFTAITILAVTSLARKIPRNHKLKDFSTHLLGIMSFLTILLVGACTYLGENGKPTLWILILLIILMPLHIFFGMFILLKGYGYE